MKEEEKKQFDVIFLDDDNYIAGQLTFPKKIIVPKCVVDIIKNEIWERINSLFTDQDAAFWKEIEIWSNYTGQQVKAAIMGRKE